MIGLSARGSKYVRLASVRSGQRLKEPRYKVHVFRVFASNSTEVPAEWSSFLAFFIVCVFSSAPQLSVRLNNIVSM